MDACVLHLVEEHDRCIADDRGVGDEKGAGLAAGKLGHPGLGGQRLARQLIGEGQGGLIASSTAR